MRTALLRSRLLPLAGAAALLVALPTAASAQSGQPFTTTPKSREHRVTVPPIPTATALRVGSHAGFDRVVLELRGPMPSWRVGYVPRVVSDGSGEPVHLRGNAFLALVVDPANAHDEQGRSTLPQRRFVTSFPSLREVRQVSDFEAVVTLGIGVRQRTGFRVVELSNPTRLVIDIAHPAPAASAAPASPAAQPIPAGNLPLTGSHDRPLLAGGTALVAAGGLLLALTRRRRATR